MIAMKFLTAALALRMLGTGPGAVVRPPDSQDPKLPSLIEPANDLPAPCRPGSVCFGAVTQPGEGWEAELTAHFARRSVRGTILFVVYDAADKHAIAKHEVTTLWMVDSDPTHQLSLRVPFDPDSGFRKNHTYRVRVVQLLRRHEVLLAEGDVRLSGS